MPLPIPDSRIGGALVQKTFTMGSRRLLAGQELSREEVMAIRRANRDSLVNKEYIRIFPMVEMPPGERFLVSRGFGKFDVVEGRMINDGPLDKETATALVAAGRGATN